MAKTTFHTLRISDIQEETKDSVSIVFEVPPPLEEDFQFLPGQYITLRRQINGKEVRRSFSLAAAPDDNELRVAVKYLRKGKFSEYAKNNMKVGDELEVMPPLGRFTPRETKTKIKGRSYVAFAAGSGITPIMSIMKSTLRHHPENKFTLFYGNKNNTNIIFKEAIEGLKNKYMERLVTHYLFTRQATDAPIFRGRINKEKVKELQKYLFDIEQMDEVFICGPEAMILNLREYFLEDAKIDTHNVHFELFTSPDQPRTKHKDWQDKAEDIDPSEVSHVTVHIDGAAQDMKVPYKGNTILDQGLLDGMDLPYSCKGGVCTTCRAKLLKGKVEMEVNYGLEPEEIEQNYILTCQAHPTTEKIEVDYDV